MFSRTTMRMCRPQFTGRVRMYSGKSKLDEFPSFKTIALVGLVGTAIFVKAVESLEQNKPKTTYTLEEYDNVMSGLKRRVAIFGQEELSLKCVQPGVSLKRVKIPKDAVVINPFEVAEYYRHIETDRFNVLLNDTYNAHGKDYLEHLPKGLIVVLLGKFMKEKCKEGDSVYIVDFPSTVKEAIKFENEVAVIDKLVVPRSNAETDICKYFNTVHKVETL